MTPVDTVARWLAFSNAGYILACLFAVFATFGIVYFGNKYTRLKEHELDQYKREADSRIADANKKAADANALAAAARADAESARTEGEKFKTERAKVELRMHEMEQAHSTLVASNATSQERIKQLEEEKKPRVISDIQQMQIAKLLKPFAGQEVEIRIYAAEHEAQMLAQQVATLVQRAGLKPALNNMLGAAGQGFGVAVHDNKSAPDLANVVLHSFRAAGVPIDGVALPDQVPEGKFFILVGAKPVRH